MIAIEVFYLGIFLLANIIVGLVSLPISSIFFGRLSDRGFSLGIIIGWLSIAYIHFVLATFKILPLSIFGILPVLFLWIFVNILLYRFYPQFELKQINLLQIAQIAFGMFVLMLFWYFIRGHSPEIYQIERFMDFGFMRTLSNSNYLPLQDMWFGGEILNYYYFGHHLGYLALTITNVPLEAGFFVLIIWIFALSGINIYRFGYEFYLFLATKEHHHYEENKFRESVAVLAGILSMLLVLMAGTFHTIYWARDGANYLKNLPENYLESEFNKFIGSDQPSVSVSTSPPATGTYWYASATRFVKGTIMEMHVYTFLVSDLHPHMWGILVGILAIFTSLEIWRGKFFRFQFDNPFIYLTAFILAIAYMMNSWDVITFGILIFATFAIRNFEKFISLIPIGMVVGGFSIIFLESYKIFLKLYGENANVSLATKDHTVAEEIGIFVLAILLIAGGILLIETFKLNLLKVVDTILLIFAVAIGAYLLTLPWSHFFKIPSPDRFPFGLVSDKLAELNSKSTEGIVYKRSSLLNWFMFWGPTVTYLSIWLVIFRNSFLKILKLGAYQVQNFYNAIFKFTKHPLNFFEGIELKFSAFNFSIFVFSIFAFFWIVLEIIYFKDILVGGEHYRANTVFKVTNQLWLWNGALLGGMIIYSFEKLSQTRFTLVQKLASGVVLVLISWLAIEIIFLGDILGTDDYAGWSVFANANFALLLIGLIYIALLSYGISLIKSRNFTTIFATLCIFITLSFQLSYPVKTIEQANAGKDFNGISLGLDWWAKKYPDDYEAYLFLNNIRENLPRNDRMRYIIEADGTSFDDYSFFSTFLGWPTPLGWYAHEWTWQGNNKIIQEHLEEVKEVFTGTDAKLTKEILDKYKVNYIIISSSERRRYEGNLNEEKLLTFGRVVFEKGQTKVIEVSGVAPDFDPGST